MDRVCVAYYLPLSATLLGVAAIAVFAFVIAVFVFVIAVFVFVIAVFVFVVVIVVIFVVIVVIVIFVIVIVVVIVVVREHAICDGGNGIGRKRPLRDWRPNFGHMFQTRCHENWLATGCGREAVDSTAAVGLKHEPRPCWCTHTRVKNENVPAV